MATERNPFDPIPTSELSIVEIESGTLENGEEEETSIEYDPEGGGVIVEFKTNADEGLSEEQKDETEEEFFSNLVEDLDDDTLDDKIVSALF